MYCFWFFRVGRVFEGEIFLVFSMVVIKVYREVYWYCSRLSLFRVGFCV